jgi:hypothetical protein
MLVKLTFGLLTGFDCRCSLHAEWPGLIELYQRGCKSITQQVVVDASVVLKKNYFFVASFIRNIVICKLKLCRKHKNKIVKTSIMWW